ncbi:hypothetical protein B0H11DRAFT_1962928 [Mycena galericulata]|nr:hypothetical protein B0H11DRAFT_1962928 [Mycena galericulata]
MSIVSIVLHRRLSPPLKFDLALVGIVMIQSFPYIVITHEMACVRYPCDGGQTAPFVDTTMRLICSIAKRHMNVHQIYFSSEYTMDRNPWTELFQALVSIHAVLVIYVANCFLFPSA